MFNYLNIIKNEIKGTALLELTITLPVLLTLAAASINICTLLWSVEYAQDAVRFASGRVLMLSAAAYNPQTGTMLSCEDLKQKVILETNQYIEDVMTINEQNIWAEPEVRIFQKEGSVNLWWAEVKLRTADITANCTFCYENLLNKINYTAMHTYALHSNPLLRCVS